MINRLNNNQKIESVTPNGVRLETLVGKYTPIAVSEKIKMLFSDENIQKQVADKLNHLGLTIDQVSEVGFLETLSRDQLRDISSSLGDIRFHSAIGPAANDELITELTKKLAA